MKFLVATPLPHLPSHPHTLLLLGREGIERIGYGNVAVEVALAVLQQAPKTELIHANAEPGRNKMGYSAGTGSFYGHLYRQHLRLVLA